MRHGAVFLRSSQSAEVRHVDHPVPGLMHSATLRQFVLGGTGA